MLSFTYLKIVFNELYACSLAFFHLCVTIILRLSKSNRNIPPLNRTNPARDYLSCPAARHKQSSLPRNSSHLPPLSSPPPCVDASGHFSSETCSGALQSSLPLVANVMPNIPSVLTASNGSDLLPSPPSDFSGPAKTDSLRAIHDPCAGILIYDTTDEERIQPDSPFVTNFQTGRIDVSEERQCIKSKYSFKRRRHTSKSSITELFDTPFGCDNLVSSPETVASIRRRIKFKRKFTPRPMLLIQDLAIDLRPLLLPEEVAQRNGFSVENNSITTYPFRTPVKSARVQMQQTQDVLEDPSDNVDAPALGIKKKDGWTGNRGDVERNYGMGMIY